MKRYRARSRSDLGSEAHDDMAIRVLAANQTLTREMKGQGSQQSKAVFSI